MQVLLFSVSTTENWKKQIYSDIHVTDTSHLNHTIMSQSLFSFYFASFTVIYIAFFGNIILAITAINAKTKRAPNNKPPKSDFEYIYI